MTLENEKRYLLLLASYDCVSKGRTPSKNDVLDCIETNKWVILSEKDLEYKHNRHELV